MVRPVRWRWWWWYPYNRYANTKEIGCKVFRPSATTSSIEYILSPSSKGLLHGLFHLLSTTWSHEHHQGKTGIQSHARTSSMTSRSVVSMRVMPLPVAFSISSIWAHVLLSCTKLIEIPLRPKRPVRPGKSRAPSTTAFVYHHRGRPRTNAVNIRLNIWPRVTTTTCTLAIGHEGQIVVHYHVDLQHVDSARDHVCRN